MKSAIGLSARTALAAGAATAALLFFTGVDAATHIAQRTAIANVFAGQSSVRIANPGNAPARHAIEIFGAGSRTSLGRFTLEVPAKASISFRPEEMIQTFAPIDWNQLLVLYVETTADDQRWQHVRRYPNGGLANATLCGAGGTSPRVQMAMNVHTTITSPTASFITLHNPTDAELALDARVTSALTGRFVGAVPITLAPHETVARSGHFFESRAGWFFPDEEQFNIEFVPRIAGFGRDLIVGHTLVDLGTGDYTNLSDPCPIKTGVTAQIVP